jgi:hypothetical protein
MTDTNSFQLSQAIFAQSRRKTKRGSFFRSPRQLESAPPKLPPGYVDWAEVRIRAAITKLEKAIAVASLAIELLYSEKATDSPWRTGPLRPYDVVKGLTEAEYGEFIRVAEQYPVAAQRLMAEQEAILSLLMRAHEFANGSIVRRVCDEGPPPNREGDRNGL